MEIKTITKPRRDNLTGRYGCSSKTKIVPQFMRGGYHRLTGSGYVNQDGLDLIIILPLLPKCPGAGMHHYAQFIDT